MIKLILTSLLFITSVYATDYKVVYNLTTPKETNFEKAILKGIVDLQNHYESRGDTLSVAVVISGGSYQFFEKKVSHSKEALEALVKRGVKFEVCSVGMSKRKIPKDAMFPFVKLAFNKTAALIEWQERDYSLINVE